MNIQQMQEKFTFSFHFLQSKFNHLLLVIIVLMHFFIDNLNEALQKMNDLKKGLF